MESIELEISEIKHLEEIPLKEYPLIHLGLRVDIDPEMDSDAYRSAFRRCLKPLGDVVYATYGKEIAKKTKKEHFHYHIGIQPTSDHVSPPSGLPSYCKRNWTGPPLPKGKGHSIYKPDIKNYPIDEFPTRWYSYPLKDYSSFDHIPQDLCLGFSEDELKSMFYVASAERAVADTKLKKYENKLNNDKQSRQLVWEWLDEELPNLCERKFRRSKVSGEMVLIDPILETAKKLVEYNRLYNDYKIPMDLQRRVISYLAYRNAMTDEQIAKHILKY